MLQVGSFAIATEDICTLDYCIKKGSRVQIKYVNDDHNTYDVEDENGKLIFGVWACELQAEAGSSLRVVLQPLSGLSDAEYDKLFSIPAQQKSKTELEILREYIRQIQITRR